MYRFKVNDKFDFETEKKGDDLAINGQTVPADIRQLGDSRWHIISNLQSYNAELVSFDAAEKTAVIKVNNNLYQVKARDQFDILLDQLGMSNLNAARIADIKAPMPGLVLKVFVNDGDAVKKGDNLFVLEAMKMENIIKAPADAVVKSIKTKPGDKVEKNQVLMMF